MSLCIVCSSLASVFCTQDKAFLCSGCDKSIHSANVLSRRHHRLPVCELCKRNGATVYCHEDAAALCAGCEAEVHSANPLPHTTVHIDQALAQGLAKVTELPSEGCCAGSANSGGSGGAAAARPSSQQQLAASVAAPQQLQHLGSANNGMPTAAAAGMTSPPLQDAQQPAEDEVSACGEHNAKRQTDAGASVHHSLSEGNTSLAVVPDMGAQGGGASAFPTMGLPSQDAINAKAPWATAFDALDFESAWFGNLDGGFDLSDLLGNDMAGLTDDAPGMVPSFPMAGPAQGLAAPSAANGAQLVPTATQPQLGLDLSDALPTFPDANTKAPHQQQQHLHQHQHQQQQQQHQSVSEVLPPNLLLDDDFVVPSFLPEDDVDAMAGHFAPRPSANQLQLQQQQPHPAMHHHALPALPTMPHHQGGEVEDEEDAEHQAARAVAMDEAGNSSTYGTRKRGASVATEELQRSAAAPVGRSAGGSKSKASVPPPPPLSGPALLALNGANLTREQRVARYREKRKNRKFHKTIRYASRKAYAEVRPRIKGRFATKEEVEAWKAKKAAGEAIAPEDELIF